MEEIRGLTLRHPWAWAFQQAGKDVENRTWHPSRQGVKVGSLLALHGGSPTIGAAYADEIKDAFEWIMVRCGKHGSNTLRRKNFPADGKITLDFLVKPGIVAVGRLVDVRRDSPSPWAVHGQYHWCLEVTPLPEAVPHRGAQGLWTLEPEALARVRALYREATA